MHSSKGPSTNIGNSIFFTFCWRDSIFINSIGTTISHKGRSHFKRSCHSFLKQKHAIWSLCVACIICSALVIYIYTTWGLLIIQHRALTIKNTGWLPRKDAGLFVEEGDKMVYTEKEKAALAVFTFVIICSVIEIVLAAAMMKICKTTEKTPQLSSSSTGYNQVLFPQYLPRIAPFEFPGVTHWFSCPVDVSIAFKDALRLRCRRFCRQD